MLLRLDEQKIRFACRRHPRSKPWTGPEKACRDAKSAKFILYRFKLIVNPI
jgi:hypothetical protein